MGNATVYYKEFRIPAGEKIYIPERKLQDGQWFPIEQFGNVAFYGEPLSQYYVATVTLGQTNLDQLPPAENNINFGLKISGSGGDQEAVFSRYQMPTVATLTQVGQITGRHGEAGLSVSWFCEKSYSSEHSPVWLEGPFACSVLIQVMDYKEL